MLCKFVTAAQRAGKDVTGTVAALAYRSAKAIREHYFKNPGRLMT